MKQSLKTYSVPLGVIFWIIAIVFWLSFPLVSWGGSRSYTYLHYGRFGVKSFFSNFPYNDYERSKVD